MATASACIELRFARFSRRNQRPTVGSRVHSRTPRYFGSEVCPWALDNNAVITAKSPAVSASTQFANYPIPTIAKSTSKRSPFVELRFKDLPRCQTCPGRLPCRATQTPWLSCRLRKKLEVSGCGDTLQDPRRPFRSKLPQSPDLRPPPLPQAELPPRWTSSRRSRSNSDANKNHSSMLRTPLDVSRIAPHSRLEDVGGGRGKQGGSDSDGECIHSPVAVLPTQSPCMRGRSFVTQT